MTVPFFELRDFPEGITNRIEQAVLQVLRGKQLILGPKVAEFEAAFAKFVGVKHCIGVGNGYDALVLSLKVAGIGTGDKVLLSANGYIAAANAVLAVGATPVFTDPDPVTANLRATEAQNALAKDIKAILPVYLFGQVTDAAELQQLCQQEGILLIEDFAQAQGASVRGKMAGSFGHINATSFYPTKNLGAAGDAGAVCTNNDAFAEQLKMLRNYGQRNRYQNQLIGVNSRLDEMQAAVLLEKLAVLPQLTDERKRLAQNYLSGLQDITGLQLPLGTDAGAHTWHLFVVRTHHQTALQQFLSDNGIQTLIHYPVPPYRQPAYSSFDLAQQRFPITDKLAATCLSLPLFPGLTAFEQDFVIGKVKEFFRKINP